jgi:hypothetical protein
LVHSQQTFPKPLRRCYYKATAAAAGAAVIGSALNLREARAQFDAPKRSVNIRVAEHPITDYNAGESARRASQ